MNEHSGLSAPDPSGEHTDDTAREDARNGLFVSRLLVRRLFSGKSLWNCLIRYVDIDR